MENHSSCPICFEFPEREIYQCSNGHILCSKCIINLTNCPQCRISFGATKIRTRVLEEILDGQVFVCKFQTEGCKRKCKRNEISKHGELCDFNPNINSFCETIGFKNCRFNVGSSSRAEILAHFKNVHKVAHESDEIVGIRHMNFSTLQAEKIPRLYMPVTYSASDNDKSPMFLVLGKLHFPVGFVSWVCILLWGPEIAQNYQVQCSFKSKSTPNSDASSSSKKAEPYRIKCRVNASAVKDIKQVMETSPFSIPVKILMDNFLQKDGVLEMRFEWHQKSGKVLAYTKRVKTYIQPIA